VEEFVVAEDRREGVRSTERVDHSTGGVGKSAREDEERRAEADLRDELRKDDDADPGATPSGRTRKKAISCERPRRRGFTRKPGVVSAGRSSTRGSLPSGSCVGVVDHAGCRPRDPMQARPPR
jgi:hypothetical protein